MTVKKYLELAQFIRLVVSMNEEMKYEITVVMCEGPLLAIADDLDVSSSTGFLGERRKNIERHMQETERADVSSIVYHIHEMIVTVIGK